MKKYIFIVCVMASLIDKNSAAQNVAINEDGSAPDPSSMLDIKSNTKGFLMPRMFTNDRLSIPNPAEGLKVYDLDTKSFWYYNGADWINIGAGSGSGTNFWAQSGSNIYNNNGGFVGIGITSPFARLHVKEDNQAMIIQGTTPYISFYDNAGVPKGFIWQGPGSNMSIGTHSGNTTGWFQVYNNNTINLELTQPGAMYIRGSSPQILWVQNGGLSGNVLANGNSLEIAARKEDFSTVPGNIILQASDITTPVFNSRYAGVVGIGTRSPIGKLHILHDGPTAHLILEYPGLNDYSRLLFTNSGASRYWGVSGKIGNGGTTTDRFVIYNTATGVENLTLTGDGNVGIGTLNPTYKLSVNGNVRSKEVVVETGWADYVFDKKYKLRSLAEVETFIQQYNHLPGIPSAKEIEENGLQLGDTQKRMMEKIEELTLYVIELQKQIQELQKK